MPNEDLIFGWHSVLAALKYEPATVKHIWIEQGRKDNRARELQAMAAPLGIAVREEPRGALDRMTGAAHHQGVVARCAAGRQALTEHDLPALIAKIQGPALLLVLDQVQDPHNVGACLRSADAAGVHAVIVPRDNASGLTPTVRKVACGAAETVPFVQVTNLARVLRMLKDDHGIWIVGGAEDAPATIDATDLKVPVALALGAEEKGLRRLTRETCDVLARIPMAGTVGSLNVSVATGIFLYEAVRQRRS